jgi:Arc/MetJ family transcription regulator
MRTHIELDDQLIHQAQDLSGLKTRKATVNAALAEYVKVLKQRRLLELRGKVEWVGDLDEMRASRDFQSE